MFRYSICWQFLQISNTYVHRSQSASYSFIEMKEFRCNGCLRHLNIGHESSVTTIDTRNPSYLTNCSHLFCDICRRRYRSICPYCRCEVQWFDTSRITIDRFQHLTVSIRRLQRVHQFQLMQNKSVHLRLMDIKQKKKQRAQDRNKKVHLLKQRYQYLKNKYSWHLTLLKKIKQIQM